MAHLHRKSLANYAQAGSAAIENILMVMICCYTVVPLDEWVELKDLVMEGDGDGLILERGNSLLKYANSLTKWQEEERNYHNTLNCKIQRHFITMKV